MQRIIKRYPNRKLYDTETSSYVSLSDVAQFVRAGETVAIVEKESGEDLTAQMLTQIILEEGKQGRSLIPVDLLHDLLRRSHQSFDARLDLVRQRFDALMQQSLGRVNPFKQDHSPDEMDALRTQLDQLERLLDRVQIDQST